MASTSAPAVGKTTAIAPAQLHTFHRNPRRGDVGAIMASLRRHTQFKPITGNIGTHTGRPLEILAGNHTLMAFRELAEAEPDDPAWQKILVHWVDVDDDMAERIVVADNQTGQLGGFDEIELAELVTGFGADIEGLGFTEADVEDLTALLEEQDDLPPVNPEPETEPTKGKREDGLIDAKDMTQRRDEYAENANNRMIVLTMPIPAFVWSQEKLEAFRTERGLKTNSEALLELLAEWSGETAPGIEPTPAELSAQADEFLDAADPEGFTE
jgi:hypothetical protein